MAPDTVKVAWAPNLPEAEMLQGLLLDAGIPSVLRRQLGFDVPDYLVAGARDVLVLAEREHDAREVLRQVQDADDPVPEPVEPTGSARRPPWVRWLAIAMVVSLAGPIVVAALLQLAALLGLPTW